MGYIKRLADRKYRIMFELPSMDGKRKQTSETLNGVTKREAEAILAERQAATKKQRDAIARKLPIPDEVILADLFEQFLNRKRELKKEANTVRRYETLVRLYLVPRFGSLNGFELQSNHLTGAYEDWLANGRDGHRISGKTIRHIHELLRNVLNWGVRKNLLSRNVALFVDNEDLPKVVNPKPLALTDDEVRRLLLEAKSPTNRSQKRGYISAQSWFHPAVAFAVYTGARRGEVLGLHWSEVNLDDATVTIQQSLTEHLELKTTKNDRSRTITMPPTLCAILKSHRATQAAEKLALGAGYTDEGFVFAKADGSKIDPWNFGRAVLDCIKRSGVTPVTLHGLRDTHASLCAKAGVPLEVVSQRLGHSSIGITASRYLYVYSERDADAADAFGRLVG